VSSTLLNLYMKHYKSVKILSNFQNVKSPCTNLNPLFKTYWRRFCFLNLTSFHATVQLRSMLTSLKNKKLANREPNSYNHLGVYVASFARVCEIFTAVVSELQRGPHVVLKSLCRHTYYIGAVCLFFLNTDKKMQMWFL